MASKGAIILITGANSGLGYLTAKLLAKSPNNYHIIVTARTLEKATDAVTSLVELTHQTNDRFSALALDINSDASLTTAFDYVQTHHGRLDVLINNAGIFPRTGPLREKWQLTFQTNVVSTAACTATFEPLLKASANGLLIFLTSSLGSLAMAAAAPKHRFDVTAYRASKAALNMLMVEKAKELMDEGVRVWGVDPGARATNLAGDVERAIANGTPDAAPGAQVTVDVVEGRKDEWVGRVVDWEGGARAW